MINILMNDVNQWFLQHGIKTVIILIVSFIFLKFSRVIIRRLITAIVKQTYKAEDSKSEIKRISTLEGAFYSITKFLIIATALLLIASEMGINIGPLLATAGLAGLALSLGGQVLIRDLIAGFFLILEDSFRKGDIIKIGEITGTVEDINIRKTIVRDLDGVLHHIPNGEIKVASNLTKGWSRVNINIGVPHDANLGKVIEILDEVSKKMAEDDEWKNKFIRAPHVLGVEGFTEKAVIIKILGKTKPTEQWDIARELRRRIKVEFDKKGIAITA